MTISEVCKKYDITADTLRYYEKIGLIPSVPRTPKGIRNYNEESCRWIELMKCMRKSGVEIKALIKYVSLFSKGDETIKERKEILIEQREKLIKQMENVQKSIDKLNMKIEGYEQSLMLKEKLIQNLHKESDKE